MGSSTPTATSRVGSHARRAATYERAQLWSGAADSALRVGVSGDVLASDGRLSLTGGDHLFRVGLGANTRRADART